MMGQGSSQSKLIPLVIRAWTEPVEVINEAVQEVGIVEEKDFHKTGVDKGITREPARMTKNIAERP
jgi:hypothetical protein